MISDQHSDSYTDDAGCNDLEKCITETGTALGKSIKKVLDMIPGSPLGPQALARKLGVNKVLTSRILKAIRSKDPIAVMHHIPGPEPLRRLLRAAGKHGAGASEVDEALKVVDHFELLIRKESGDRGSFNAIISAWLPEARRDFELRRKQAAFRALSELKGAFIETNLSTVILHPSEDGERMDVVWLIGLLGLQRLRPGALVKLSSRRLGNPERPRQPVNLDGEPIHTLCDACLETFSSLSNSKINTYTIGEVMIFTLGTETFGRRSAEDYVFAEVNKADLKIYIPNRKANVFAEVSIPSKYLLFDVFIHEEIDPDTEPQLHIYDTAFDGVASVNDPSRDVDRMELMESIQTLGWGLAKCRHAKVCDYIEMLRSIFSKLGWNDKKFRLYRCAVDYPLYGTQVTMAFFPAKPPEKSS